MSEKPCARTPEDRAAAPRGWLALIRDPRFGRYLLGRTLSSGGVWIHNVTAAILAYEVTGSAFIVGLISVAQFTPQLLLAPLSGAQADRGHRKRQVVTGRVIVAAGSTALALWLMTTDASPTVNVWALLVSALVVGIGFVTGGPAMQAIFPSLVRRSELGAAVTLNTAPVTLARAVGPALGTGIAVAFGPPIALLVAAAFNLAFVLILVPMVIPSHTKDPESDSSVRAAIRHLGVDPRLAVLLVCVAAVGVLADPAVTLAPAISTQLTGSPALTGAFASAFGVGAGVAFVVIGVLRRWVHMNWNGPLGFLLGATGMLALVVGDHSAIAWVSFAISGIGMTMSLTSLSAQIQSRLPEDLRGRIMALWSVAFLGSRPLAAAINGAVADAFTMGAALVLVVAISLVAAWLCSPRALDRRIRR